MGSGTNRKAKIIGIPSGLKDLDNITGGFKDGSLIVVAGRPCMGKTTLAISIALNSAFVYEKKVAIFELEASAMSLILRMASTLSKVELGRIMKDSFGNKEEQDKVPKTINKLRRAPIYIDETPILTYAGMEAKIRKLKKEKGIDILIIDYLQLVEGEDSSMTNIQQCSKVLQSLKVLAKELNILVVVLSQINRMVENRKNKRPILTDLKKINRIEQYADIIILLYRDEIYNKNTKEKGIVEINIVNKSRHLGTAKLKFESKTASFVDISNISN